jgi:hypothetical protein
VDDTTRVGAFGAGYRGMLAEATARWLPLPFDRNDVLAAVGLAGHA